MKKMYVYILLFLSINQVKSQNPSSVYAWEANDLKMQYLIEYSLTDIGTLIMDTLYIDSIINHFDVNEKIYNNSIVSDNYIFDLNKLEYRKAFNNIEKNSIFLCEFQAIGDTIFYSKYRDSLEYYYYDFSHDSLVKMNKDLYKAFSLLSPDKTKGLFYNHNTHSIELLSSDSKKELGEFFYEIEDTEKDYGNFPMIWIDNQCFLTQTSNGKIVKVYLNGTIKDIVDIKINKKALIMPVLYKDCNNNYYYYIVFKRKFTFFCHYPYIERNYLLLPKEKTYKNTNFIGCNFSYLFRKNNLIIKQTGIKIGGFKNYDSFVFNNNILAINYLENKHRMLFLYNINTHKSLRYNVKSKYFKLIDFWL